MDLTAQLSNLQGPLARILDGKKPVVGRTVVMVQARPQQRQVRLSERKQLALVKRYIDGAPQRELAELYGVQRRTVSAIVKRHGAARQPGLNDGQVDKAVDQYAAGQSLAAIGSALKVDAATVRSRLLERGVVMRDTHGRTR